MSSQLRRYYILYRSSILTRELHSQQVQRFASRSRARLRADILGDDVSTVASTVSSMTTSSSATATPSSSSTASAKRLPSSKDAKVQDSRAPALRPGSGTISSFLRSARSGNSLTSWVSVPSGRNTATVSSRPPPLLKGSGAAGGGRGAGQLTSANLAAATGGPPSAEGNCVSGAGAAGNGGERIRRRASFFAGLAKKGNSASSKVSKDTSS